MSTTTPELESFKKIVATRHATRGFINKEVPKDVILSILQDANNSPSNCNTQPWNVIILTGEKLEALRQHIVAFYKESGIPGGDFSFDYSYFTGRILNNKDEQGKKYYSTVNVQRGDKDARGDHIVQNINGFGAAHLALVFLETPMGDNVRACADLGMYSQTFLLSCVAHGLGGLPQTLWGMFSPEVKKFLNIPEEKPLLLGMSFGYEDPEAVGNSFKMDRNPLEDTVTFM